MSLALRRRLMLGLSNVSVSPLSRIDIAEVSMLCVDRSDGKSGYIDLTAISSDGGPMGALTWISSNNSLATVTPISQTKASVTAVSGAALGSAVTISCTQGAIVKTCSVTVFSTMPNNNASLLGLKGGCGWFTFLTVIDALKIASELEAHMFAGRQVRSSTSEAGLYSIVNANSASFISLDEAGLASCWVRKVTFNGNTRTLRNYNGFSYRSPGTLVLEAYTPNGETIFVNDEEVSVSFYNTTSDAPNSYISLARCGSTQYAGRKITWQANAPLNTSKNAMWNRLNCRLCHCPQNYIRYTDHDSYVNYTVIQNIGTLGHGYDLTANNVPSLWFGV